MTLGKSLHFFKYPFASLWGWFYVHMTCAVTQDPAFPMALCLVQCSAIVILKFLLILNKWPMFPLCIDPTNYVDSPVYQPSEDNNTCLTISLKLPCLGPIEEPDTQNSELLLLSLSHRITKTSVRSGPGSDSSLDKVMEGDRRK